MLHVPWRACILAGLQTVADDDEYSPEQLAPRPADGAADLGPNRESDFDEHLERNRHERETHRAEHAEDDVRHHDRPRGGRPDKDQIASRDDGDAGFQKGYVRFGTVDDRGGDSGADEADDDEQGAGDTRLVFGKPVRGEDLRQERGGRIEERDVDGERGEEEEKVFVSGEERKGLPEGWPDVVGRGGGRRGWFHGHEERGNGDNGGDEGNDEGHFGDVRWFGREKRVDQLAKRGAERIGERGDRGGRDAAAGENQRFEYSVGAARTNGWARPIRTWPVMTRGKDGGEVRVPP